MKNLIKNKVGFTLVEILGVFFIIGLLTLIITPAIGRYINQGKQEYYNNIEKEVKVAGVEYLNTYRSLLPRVIGHRSVIDLKELEENNYIEEITDADGDKCSGQVVVKKENTDKYTYTTCIKCGSKYQTKNGSECKKGDTETGFENNEIDNEYEDSDDYRIDIDDIYDELKDLGYDIDLSSDPIKYYVPQTYPFKMPKVSVKHLEQGEWKTVDGEVKVTPKEIDTNKLGTTKVAFYYHGAVTYIDVVVIDITKPTKPEVVVKYENIDGSNYQGNWYNGIIYVEYHSTDFVKAGIMGSGVEYFEYSLDGENWKKVLRNGRNADWQLIDMSAADSEKVIPKDGEYEIKVRAVDKYKNVSDENSYVVRMDTKKPSCTLKVLSGTIGNNNWYKSNIVVGYYIKDGTASNVLTSPIKYVRNDGVTIKSETSVEINTQEQNLRVYATLTDEAGNISICELEGLDGTNRVKVDPFIPTITSQNDTIYVYTNQSTDINSYYTPTYGISNGYIECRLNNKDVITNINSFSSSTTRVNSVTCNSISNAGNVSDPVTVSYHQQYTASGACSGSGQLQNNTSCYYESNSSVCGTHNCNPHDCNPHNCNPYDCNPHNGSCIAWNYRTKWCSYTSTIGVGQNCELTTCMGKSNCSCSGSGNSSTSVTCSCSYSCGSEKSSCKTYETLYDTCYNTCHDTCYDQCASSCSKNSGYISYSCPNGGTLYGTYNTTSNGALCRY